MKMYGVLGCPKCIYATARNTPSVRSGHEMGGYLKKACEKHAKQYEEKPKDKPNAS